MTFNRKVQIMVIHLNMFNLHLENSHIFKYLDTSVILFHFQKAMVDFLSHKT